MGKCADVHHTISIVSSPIFSVYSVEKESCHWKISNALSNAFTFVIWSGSMFQPKIVTCSKICSLPFHRFTGMLFGWTVCVCVLYWYRDTLVNLLRWNHSYYFTFADIAIRDRFRSENGIFHKKRKKNGESTRKTASKRAMNSISRMCSVQWM